MRRLPSAGCEARCCGWVTWTSPAWAEFQSRRVSWSLRDPVLNVQPDGVLNILHRLFVAFSLAVATLQRRAGHEVSVRVGFDHNRQSQVLHTWIIGSLPRHGLDDAVEVLQRAVLQHDAAFAVAVGNRDPHPQRATQVLLRFADIWVHNSLLFGRGTRL